MFVNNNFNNLWSMWQTNTTGSGNRNRNTITSMAKSNAFSDFSGDFSRPAADVRSAANLLTATLNGMRFGNSATFNPVNTVTSANADNLRIASFEPSRLRAANVSGMKDFSVETLQLAQAQQNRGNALNATALAVEDGGFEVGTHSFSLNVGSRTFDFEIQVSDTDTIRDVQQRMAAAINSRNSGANASGVGASVEFNSQTGESTLVMTSAATGVRNSGQPNFMLLETSGNALSMTGGTAITREAQNAQFRVNHRGTTGALQTSASNNVNLGLFGINAELRTVGTTQVNLGSDSREQIGVMRDFVNAYNDLVKTGGSRVRQDFSRLVASYASSLGRMGISMNRDGLLQIDEKGMNAAAESGALGRFVSEGRSSNFGFITRLSRTAEGIARNPMQFADRDSFTASWGFNDNDFWGFNTGFLNMGFLFDSRA